MAKMSSVDIARIAAAAGKLADLDMEILGCVRKISDTLAFLDQGWQSEVKASFMQTWQTDAEALCEMMDQYEEIEHLILQAAKDFETKEREIASYVASLR